MLRKTELVIFKSKRKKIVNEIKLILKFFPTNRIKIDENVTWKLHIIVCKGVSSPLFKVTTPGPSLPPLFKILVSSTLYSIPPPFKVFQTVPPPPPPTFLQPPPASIRHTSLPYTLLMGLNKYQKDYFTSSNFAFYQKSIFNFLNSFTNISSYLNLWDIFRFILSQLRMTFFIK